MQKEVDFTVTEFNQDDVSKLSLHHVYQPITSNCHNDTPHPIAGRRINNRNLLNAMIEDDLNNLIVCIMCSGIFRFTPGLCPVELDDIDPPLYNA